MTDIKDCESAVLLMQSVIDGEASDDEKSVLEAHLDICPDCAELYKELSYLSDNMSDYAVEIPDNLTSSVMLKIKDEKIADMPKAKARRKRVSKTVKRWCGIGAFAVAAAAIAIVSVKLTGFDMSGSASNADYAYDTAAYADASTSAASTEESAERFALTASGAGDYTESVVEGDPDGEIYAKTDEVLYDAPNETSADSAPASNKESAAADNSVLPEAMLTGASNESAAAPYDQTLYNIANETMIINGYDDYNEVFISDSDISSEDIPAVFDNSVPLYTEDSVRVYLVKSEDDELLTSIEALGVYFYCVPNDADGGYSARTSALVFRVAE